MDTVAIGTERIDATAVGTDWIDAAPVLNHRIDAAPVCTDTAVVPSDPGHLHPGRHQPNKQEGQVRGRQDQEAGRGAGQVQGPDPQDPPRTLPGGHLKSRAIIRLLKLRRMSRRGAQHALKPDLQPRRSRLRRRWPQGRPADYEWHEGR